MTIAWVERLGPENLASLWLRSALGGWDVRYDAQAARPSGLFLLRFLQRFGLARRFKPADLRLGRDAAGRALNYRREAELDAIAESFCSRLEERGPDFRRVVKSFLCNGLMFRVTFVLMAEAAARELPGDRHVFYLTRHPANGLILDFYGARGLRLVQSWSPLETAKRIAGPVWTLLRVLWSSAFGGAVRRGPGPVRPSIWVEYYPDDLRGYVSRAFWREHAVSRRYDRVFYLDRSDTPCDAETQARIQEAGFQWVDCRRPWAMARLGGADVSALLAVLVAPDPRRPLWFRFFRFEFELWIRIWADIFRRSQVKLLIQHQEFLWKQAAQARALDLAGGGMVGFHWSDYPFTTEPIHLNAEHLFFVWGKTAYLWLEGKGNDCRRVLPCGVWIVPEERDAEGLRARLAGADLAFAIFDSSAAYNIYFQPRDLSDFLLAMIEELETHPSWRAVLKPKGAADYAWLPEGEGINARIDALRRTGRLLVTDRLISPASVARAVDVSACFGFNSAGVVAGAFGGRAVHWDAAGWRDHPLYKDPDQRIVFPSLDGLRRALADAAGGDARVGDFAKWRTLTNHFDDREAARRVGEWIRDYMDRVLGGAPAPRALEGASEAYLSRNGVPPEFFQDAGWWAAPFCSVL